MQKKFTLVVILLLAYTFACVLLAFYLASNPYTPKGIGLIHGRTQLPTMTKITDIPTRKETFINLLLPLIEAKNNAVSQVRDNLHGMQKQLAGEGKLSRANKVRLKRLARRYKVDTDEVATTAILAELLVRVDSLPPSMVLAQAAAESGWGTSRFAREGLNLFGQWCYVKGCGIVPKRRAANARHEVQAFDSLEQAVNAYYHNINSHRAYAEVRELRARARAQQNSLNGSQLVAGLGSYSSRGQAYVNELVELIDYNRLEQFDNNTLADASE